MFSRLLGRVAMLAGSSLRLGRTYATGLLGAAAVTFGVWHLAGIGWAAIAAGVFLLVVDGRRG